MKKSKARSIDAPRQSLRGLSRALGTTVKTLAKYLKRLDSPERGTDRLYDVGAVKEYIDAQRRGDPARTLPPDGDPDYMDWTGAGVHMRLSAWLQSRLPRAAAGRTENEISELLSKFLVQFDELRQAGRLPSWDHLAARRQGPPIEAE